MKRLWSSCLRIAPLLLAMAAAGALYGLSARYPLQWDVTQNALNSLEPGSVQALSLLHGPVQITVYATEKDAQVGDMRKLIREFISIYQRYKPDIKLAFVDPLKDAQAMHKAAISSNGEMVIEYAGRNEHITTLNEQTLSGALLRLAHTPDQLLMYVDGHGERKLDGPANFDLGEFGARLQQLGYHISSLNLVLAQQVPANASMLVIAQPQVQLLPGEVKKLLDYIDNGGNVLWLLDAEPLHGLQPLADKLGVSILPGIVIDPAARDMNAPLDWALGTGYPPHAVTRDFDLVSVFPDARALSVEPRDGWEAHTLVEGAQRGWLSDHGISPHQDRKRDAAGPFSLAIALQRIWHDHEQRIVVAGSGAFLSNMYSGNGGNLGLGANMVNWLANEDRFINVQPHAARDAKIVLSRNQLILLSTSFLLVIPLLLAGIGGWQWWRRRG